MDRLGGRAPRPLRTIATLLVVAVVLLLVFFGLVRVWGEAGGFAAAGVIAVGIAVWELAWERPRRERRLRAITESQQRSPGMQPLRSEASARHWSDRLPQPLATVTTAAPITLATVCVLVVAWVTAPALLDTEPGDGRLHAPLAIGSSGEVRPLQAGKDRLKVAILNIAGGAEVDVVSRNPPPGMKFWAVEIEVENTGERQFQAPGWKLLDSEDHEHDPTSIVGSGASGFPLDPGHKATRWVVFEIPEGATPQQLRVIPAVRHEALIPREISFDAE